MHRKILPSLSFVCLLLSPSSAAPQSSSAHFRIQTFSSADAQYLRRAFKALEKARKDLLSLGLNPPQRVTVIVHPTLERFQKSLEAPMFEAARANRNLARIETQRFRALEEHGGLEQTLRHELFHLAQPANWPRWKAEGSAVRFSGERLNGVLFENISESKLEALLKNPPSRAVLARAMATALEWVVQNRAISD
ncbi:MAG: hypothetical protein H7095_07260 [Pseudopedobacter sp.]|nr:hypothetical protein [Deinococcales bacterium]